MLVKTSTTLRLWLGIESNKTSHIEKIISAIGALLGISITIALTSLTLHTDLLSPASVLIIASLGATAVLLFAVPHGALSQPWPIIGGHLISAFIGVTCHKYLPETAISAGLAVGLSVGAMYYLRCIHPPGGATALTAVVGGPDIFILGYDYLLYPLLVNVLVLVTVAILFNYLFSWRRYPAHLNAKHFQSLPHPAHLNEDISLTTEDFNAAIQGLDSFVDITEEGLTELLELAKQHAETKIEHPNAIKSGHYYSNGKIGNLWSIRQIIDNGITNKANNDLIIYKIVAGLGTDTTGSSERETFRLWARFEVVEENDLWIKAKNTTSS
jgi:CBS-domain-containing membrane protein